MNLNNFSHVLRLTIFSEAYIQFSFELISAGLSVTKQKVV